MDLSDIDRVILYAHALAYLNGICDIRLLFVRQHHADHIFFSQCSGTQCRSHGGVLSAGDAQYHFVKAILLRMFFDHCDQPVPYCFCIEIVPVHSLFLLLHQMEAPHIIIIIISTEKVFCQLL